MLNEREPAHEEAEKLRRCNASGLWQMIGKLFEGRPDGLKHDLETLTALVCLSSEPEYCRNGTTENGQVDTTGTKASSGEYRKLQGVNTRLHNNCTSLTLIP